MLINSGSDFLFQNAIQLCFCLSRTALFSWSKHCHLEFIPNSWHYPFHNSSYPIFTGAKRLPHSDVPKIVISFNFLAISRTVIH